MGIFSYSVVETELLCLKAPATIYYILRVCPRFFCKYLELVQLVLCLNEYE